MTGRCGRSGLKGEEYRFGKAGTRECCNWL